MPTYEYEGVDARGDSVQGVLAASDQEAFVVLMRAEGVDVVAARVVPDGYAPFVQRRQIATRSRLSSRAIPAWLLSVTCIMLLVTSALLWLPRGPEQLLNDYRTALDEGVTRYQDVAKTVVAQCSEAGLERRRFGSQSAPVASLKSPPGLMTELELVDLVDDRALRASLGPTTLLGTSLYQRVHELLGTAPGELPSGDQLERLFKLFLAQKWVAVVSFSLPEVPEAPIVSDLRQASQLSGFTEMAPLSSPPTGCVCLVELFGGRHLGTRIFELDRVEARGRGDAPELLSSRRKRRLLERMGWR